MPLYEYKCTKCGEVFEALQKFSDKPLARCKLCKGKVERLISNSTFHLKGSGWYVTDYARKGEKSAAEPEKKSTESTDSTDSTDSKKKTSKPAAKKPASTKKD